MRTWIFGGALIISVTISPEMQYPIGISVFAILLIVAGAWFDFVDFAKD